MTPGHRRIFKQDLKTKTSILYRDRTCVQKSAGTTVQRKFLSDQLYCDWLKQLYKVAALYFRQTVVCN